MRRLLLHAGGPPLTDVTAVQRLVPVLRLRYKGGRVGRNTSVSTNMCRTTPLLSHCICPAEKAVTSLNPNQQHASSRPSSSNGLPAASRLPTVESLPTASSQQPQAVCSTPAASHLQHRLPCYEGKGKLAVSARVSYDHALPEAVGLLIVRRHSSRDLRTRQAHANRRSSPVSASCTATCSSCIEASTAQCCCPHVSPLLRLHFLLHGSLHCTRPGTALHPTCLAAE
jgi:hypothetical protein